jgi:hypothetical protein
MSRINFSSLASHQHLALSDAKVLVIEETCIDFLPCNRLRKKKGGEGIGKSSVVYARLEYVAEFHFVLPSAEQVYIVVNLHKVM